jgi:hypothetical protein
LIKNYLLIFSVLEVALNSYLRNESTSGAPFQRDMYSMAFKNAASYVGEGEGTRKGGRKGGGRKEERGRRKQGGGREEGRKEEGRNESTGGLPFQRDMCSWLLRMLCRMWEGKEEE